MLGRRDDQQSLFSADNQFLQFVGEDSFYGFLARHGRRLFRDEEFAALYCPDNGRHGVPPSLLCIALLLQAHDRVSDAEATRRATLDLSWKVALGLDLEARPFAKSTLQLFRSQLVIHQQAQAIFRRSLEFARQSGYLRGRTMKAPVDSTIILGRGAVEDTYNLIAHGIAKLCRVLAPLAGQAPEQFASAHGVERYLAPSIKGTVELDWDDAAARERFLNGLIADGQRCLQLAREARAQLEPGSSAACAIRSSSSLPSSSLERTCRASASTRWPSAISPLRNASRACASSQSTCRLALVDEPK